MPYFKKALELILVGLAVEVEHMKKAGEDLKLSHPMSFLVKSVQPSGASLKWPLVYVKGQNSGSFLYVGAGVGFSVGSARGDRLGASVGGGTGFQVGDTIGARVGSSVGIGVGSGVGSETGESVGEAIGLSVGSEMGTRVGSGVGNSVGAGEGGEVGVEIGDKVGAGVAAVL